MTDATSHDRIELPGGWYFLSDINISNHCALHTVSGVWVAEIRKDNAIALAVTMNALTQSAVDRDAIAKTVSDAILDGVRQAQAKIGAPVAETAGKPAQHDREAMARGMRAAVKKAIPEYCTLSFEERALGWLAAADYAIATIVGPVEVPVAETRKAVLAEVREAVARDIFGLLTHANPNAFHPAFEHDAEVWFAAADAAIARMGKVPQGHGAQTRNMSADPETGLLPCPFCGGAAIAEPTACSSGETIQISCGNLDCDLCPYFIGPTPDSAKAKWNTRAPVAAPPNHRGDANDMGVTVPKGTRRWRHVKRGTNYTELNRATVQNSSPFGIYERDVIVTYRGDDGKVWAREQSEFEDGRFVEVKPLQEQSIALAPEDAGLELAEHIADHWHQRFLKMRENLLNSFQRSDFSNRSIGAKQVLDAIKAERARLNKAELGERR